MEKARTEAFSDGVFAIAITLLILEIKVPESHNLNNAALAAELAATWPSFFAFVLSFATILITWINHHSLFALLRQVDRRLLLANGLLLLVVTFMPYPTALLAEHLEDESANTAAVVYCSTNFALNLAFNLFWRIATRCHLVNQNIPSNRLRSIRIAYAFAAPVYLAAVVLAWFLPIVGVVLSSLLWLLWTTMNYSANPRSSESPPQ